MSSFNELKIYFYWKYMPIHQWLYAKRLKHKKRINVVFFAASLSMWRYQHLYELMSKHSRFNIKIVIQPFNDWPQLAKDESINELKFFFDSKQIPYILGTNPNVGLIDLKNDNP